MFVCVCTVLYRILSFLKGVSSNFGVDVEGCLAHNNLGSLGYAPPGVFFLFFLIL